VLLLLPSGVTYLVRVVVKRIIALVEFHNLPKKFRKRACKILQINTEIAVFTFFGLWRVGASE